MDIWMIYGWYMDIWYINICRCRHHQTYVAANDSDRKSHSEPARRTPCTSCGKTRMMKRGQAIHWGQPGKKTIVYNIFVHYIIIYIYICVYTYITLHYIYIYTYIYITYIHTYIYIYIHIYYSVCTVISVNGRYQRDPLYGRCCGISEGWWKKWPGLVNLPKNEGKSPFFMGKLWKITISNGKTHDFNGHFQ